MAVRKAVIRSGPLREERTGLYRSVARKMRGFMNLSVVMERFRISCRGRNASFRTLRDGAIRLGQRALSTNASRCASQDAGNLLCGYWPAPTSKRPKATPSIKSGASCASNDAPGSNDDVLIHFNDGVHVVEFLEDVGVWRFPVSQTQSG